MTDKWLKEKAEFKKSVQALVNDLAGESNCSQDLILTILAVADRAATANRREWYKENYIAWLAELQARLN